MDFNSVKGKVAIVTGASRGIDRAIAECFGENGMKVVCAARSAEQGQAVADGICAKGGDAIFIQTDCSKASAIKELVDKTVAHYGKLDGVVSNAGIGMGGIARASWRNIMLRYWVLQYRLSWILRTVSSS